MRQDINIRCLKFFVVFALFALHIPECYGRKTHDMIYYDILSFAPCVRRFNATHQVGCTSDFNGNNGVIHYIEQQADLTWLLANGTYGPYITVLTPPMFTLENVKSLLDSGKVNGMMVDHTNVSDVIDNKNYFSPDKSCPNDNFGLYSGDPEYEHCSQVEWNSVGNGMSFMDLGIPVFALTNHTEVDFLINQCYRVHNQRTPDGRAQPFPQCAGEMYDFMFGAKDTPTCIWRTQRMTNLEPSYYCDPLGDSNVWATVQVTNKSRPLRDKSVIVAAAQLDATSLFYSVAPQPGAENVISGFVTMLAAAEVLGRLDPQIKEEMDTIMFTFFQGESYDYIGSSRVAYDMTQGEFPIELDDSKYQPAIVNLSTVAAFLEVRQLALANQKTFYSHVDPLSQKDNATAEKTSTILELLRNSSSTTNITVADAPSGQPLPPASFQQFLKTGTNIPGVVITDHMAEYSNKYFNSRLDIPYALGINYTDYNDTDDLPIFPLAEDLADVATTIARTLYLLARPTASDAETLQANVTLVNDLLYCFMHRPNCSQLRAVVAHDELKSLSNTPFRLYVGVYTETSSVTLLVSRLLAYYLGHLTPMRVAHHQDHCKAEDNDQIFTYFFAQGPVPNDTHGFCIKSTVHKPAATSPAFDSDSPDWGSTVYSTWTESQWGKYYVRAFLKPSRSQESLIFSLGMIVLLLSLGMTYLLSRRIEDLFP